MSYDPKRATGSNVKKLITKRMAAIAIPPRSDDPFGAAIGALLDSSKMQAHARQAMTEMFAAIDAIKAAPDNEWGNDDEAIAAGILREMDARKAAR